MITPSIPHTADKNILPIRSTLPWFRSLTFTVAFTEKLHQLGIDSTQRLMTHLPYRYEDLSRIALLKEAVVGESAQFEVTIRSLSTRGFGRKKSTILHVTDGSSEAVVRFFNLYPTQSQALTPGTRLRIYGELKSESGVRELLHPRWTLVDRAPPLSPQLSPIYPLTTGLNQTTLAKQIDRVFEKMPDEILPMVLVHGRALPTLKVALQQLHHPPTHIALESLMSPKFPARQRCKRDELLALQLLLRRIKENTRSRMSYVLPNELPEKLKISEQLIKNLPFQLTRAQKKVWLEIQSDLESSSPMARLLQGDVGSGKTIIALLACCRALEHGYQAVVMAPTEILAEQHYERFTELLRPLGINIGWLSASVTGREKQELASLVRQRLINVVVGTHALIEDTLEFPFLALTIIDEQHRFGVRQRLRLQDRNKNIQGTDEKLPLLPHQLMMSATPIPRTLAMSHYAHLDVSVLDELPPGRQPIRTRLVNHERRHDIYRFINTTLDQGQQVYWICPLIEESDVLQLQTAHQTQLRLKEDLPLWRDKIGLLHGRMSHDQKHMVMADFVENRLSLLVSTTVVEVGVDVPNACVMVIENAERFGLAQLHQLRGRVGRGATQSVCILLFQEPLTEDAKARLKVMFEHTDGFEVAAEDLRIRGPGEIIGDKQSGIPPLRFANLSEDLHLLEDARNLAPILLRDYPEVAEQVIEFWMPQAKEMENFYRA